MTDKLTKMMAEQSFELGRTTGAADFASFLMDNGVDAIAMFDLLKRFLLRTEQPQQQHLIN